MSEQTHEHEHKHGHGHEEPEISLEDMFKAEYWDDRYASSERVWSGNPNPSLVRHAPELKPGTAMDVGAGEGADAIWLARQGWDVTAVDVSQVALDRGAEHAGDLKITWQQADLFAWVPPADSFDLVTAHYVHVPRLELDALYRRLAAAVAPGGSLLVVGHAPVDDTEMPEALKALRFTSAEIAGLLDPAGWDVVVSEDVLRSHQHHGEIHDAVLLARRKG